MIASTISLLFPMNFHEHNNGNLSLRLTTYPSAKGMYAMSSKRPLVRGKASLNPQGWCPNFGTHPVLQTFTNVRCQNFLLGFRAGVGSRVYTPCNITELHLHSLESYMVYVENGSLQLFG